MKDETGRIVTIVVGGVAFAIWVAFAFAAVHFICKYW